MQSNFHLTSQKCAKLIFNFSSWGQFYKTESLEVSASLSIQTKFPFYRSTLNELKLGNVKNPSLAFFVRVLARFAAEADLQKFSTTMGRCHLKIFQNGTEKKKKIEKVGGSQFFSITLSFPFFCMDGSSCSAHATHSHSKTNFNKKKF